ncbi:hypothetical protein C491_11343 [Natronococcus amylolyticus DSM 10524]|uniref:Cox cluster protein n=1 Tax=Natronococcus amylolyticus DSM 10524 TaxID=1227497 RepID=L9X8Z6_9EURY|nr:hypothetical protein [Natronococcus amylolyticus]ELY57098.1 hypothetical protein C491_11343 [Natronococcus amylolyticus DSM 10524]
MATDSDRRDGRSLERRRLAVALGLALVAAAAALGALLGYTIPARTGVEDVTVLEITFVASPTTGALYAGVTVGVFLATLAFVFASIARFEDD